MRAIDADRLLEERRIHTYYHLPNGDIAIPLIDIKNAPTIEPERKKGKWITNSTIINCSVCKHCSWTKSSFKDLVMSFNYCPNCGADMRTPVEIARSIVHKVIDNSVWADSVDTAKMHKVVDDKYAEIRGDANADVES